MFPNSWYNRKTDFTGQPKELVPGSIRGYRFWRRTSASAVVSSWDPEAKKLAYRKVNNATGVCSVSQAAPWDIGSPFSGAYCVYHAEHKAPEASCQCGIYAWYSPELIDGSYLPAGNQKDARTPEEVAAKIYPSYVFGAIESWGRIILGTKGYRAEFSRIVGIVLPKPPHPDVATYATHNPHLPSWTMGATKDGNNGVDPLVAYIAMYGKRWNIEVFDTRESLLERLPPLDMTDLLGTRRPVGEEEDPK